jgi:hypothetical protein
MSLHKQVFNFKPYYELHDTRQQKDGKDMTYELIHVPQNHANPNLIREHIQATMNLMIIYGNIGTMTKWLDNEGEHRSVNVDIQQNINSRYINKLMDIIPEVIKHRYPVKGNDLSEVHNIVKQYYLTPHHFLGTGIVPIPTVMQTPFMKFNTVHKLMMSTYRNEPTQPVLGINGQPIQRRMYL